MFLFTSMMGLVVFLYVAIKTFGIRKHPYTILAFSGAVTYAIATVEIIKTIELEWSSLIILPLSLLIAFFSYKVVKDMGKLKGKEIIVKSLLPLTFVVVYFTMVNIFFIAPLLVMSILSTFLVPKQIKKERKNLFVVKN